MTPLDEERGSLEPVGITEPEECAYRILLERSGATAHELAEAMMLPSHNAQYLLDSIMAKGLATRSRDPSCRYLPAAPDIVLDALIFKYQEDLQRVRGTIYRLKDLATASRNIRSGDQIVELIASHEAERQIYEQIQNAAQEEVRFLARPPMLISSLEKPDETVRAAIQRGVRYKIIADQEFLKLPGASQRVRVGVAAGEDIRISQSLPFKMIIADRQTALVPFDLDEPGGPVLLVRSSALLDALSALFDILWEQAVPIALPTIGTVERGDPGSGFVADIEEVLPLMAAGLNDKVIANELNVSVRTLERRIMQLMTSLGAQTRFQAGWLSALRMKPNAMNGGKNPKRRMRG